MGFIPSQTLVLAQFLAGLASEGNSQQIGGWEEGEDRAFLSFSLLWEVRGSRVVSEVSLVASASQAICFQFLPGDLSLRYW